MSLEGGEARRGEARRGEARGGEGMGGDGRGDCYTYYDGTTIFI